MAIVPAAGSTRIGRHKKVVQPLFLGRRFEAVNVTPCGLTPDITCLIVLSLPAASSA